MREEESESSAVTPQNDPEACRGKSEAVWPLAVRAHGK